MNAPWTDPGLRELLALAALAAFGAGLALARDDRRLRSDDSWGDAPFTLTRPHRTARITLPRASRTVLRCSSSAVATSREGHRFANIRPNRPGSPAPTMGAGTPTPPPSPLLPAS